MSRESFMNPMFQGYSCVDDYLKDGIKFLTPMTCKEVEEEEEQDKLFNDPDYYIEEKLDGTRGTLFLFQNYARLFSRHISKKTGWFCENTDSVPHIRDYFECQLSALNESNLDGTVLDGEMYIPNRPFKDVSSTLNCLWDEAVRRQAKLGFICIRVFDIRYYKGIKLENMPLYRRKEYLKRAVKQLASPYVVLHEYYDDRVPLTETMRECCVNYVGDLEADYPTLALDMEYTDDNKEYTLSKKGFYEYIVMCGGEGVILKSKNGKYHEKRGREFQKIKKFITRDVVVTGFDPPTKIYEGKFPKDFWAYWLTPDNLKFECTSGSAKGLLNTGYTPVTRFWFKDWIGALRFGVVITPDEIDNLPKNKKFTIEPFVDFKNKQKAHVIEVGDCSGFDDDTRQYLSQNLEGLINQQVIEVKANDVFKDTGRLRHPRFLRFRPDKNLSECIWSEHTHTSTVYTKEV